MALPQPTPGLVISYNFLWHREHSMRRSEGAKTRPCVVILAVTYEGGEITVTVAPITHRKPSDATTALKLPPRVKQHLKLDSDQSWIVLDELNRFGWPGFDLRPIPRSKDQFDYGHLPPKLFQRVVDGIRQVWQRGDGRTVPRDGPVRRRK
jgi:hypothetical protein